MYINSINYFRAFSIIFIVFGHCIYVSDFEYQTIIGKVLQNLTLGGTVFFVIISGFLFHHIYYPKFNFKKFYIKKLKYVFMPYLFMSIIPIIIHIYLNNQGMYDSFKQVFYFLVTGLHLTAHWYIPFIMVVFALSPLFVHFIQLRIKTQIIITLLLLCISVLIHRPNTPSLIILQSLFYFTPAYLFGMICSEKKELIYNVLKGKEYYLIGFTIILALIQVFYGNLGSHAKNPFEYAGVDLIIIQKIVFSIFFIVWLHRFENVTFKFLNLVAANSFGIFFIHGFFTAGFGLIKSYFNFSFSNNSFLTYYLMALIIFSLSLITSMLIRKLFPKYSRFIIGS